MSCVLSNYSGSAHIATGKHEPPAELHPPPPSAMLALDGHLKQIKPLPDFRAAAAGAKRRRT